MKNYGFSVIVTLGVISICGRGVSQTNTAPFPTIPPVGIGTQLDGGTISALQIHFDPGLLTMTWPAILRLSNGDNTNSDVFGILGLMPPPMTTAYSSLSKGQDLILHENKSGDIIITNYWAAPSAPAVSGGSIRFATAGDSTTYVLPKPPEKDFERMTIAPNGNIGINLPKDAIPKDQMQIGGGVMPYPGNPFPDPGLTIYGGNRYENMLNNSGTFFPGDWRYISYNRWCDHTNPGSNRYHRFDSISTSTISFSEQSGGMIDLSCAPYDVTRGMDDFTHYLTLKVTGTGLVMWSDEGGSDQNHHLIEIFRPGYSYSWDSVRNVHGLCFMHTPMYIGTDTTNPWPNFTDFAHVNPTLGDGKTWMLAVNGPMLAKEIFVLDTVWADFVFQPEYKLPTLAEVEAYTKANHHLPGVPAASEIAKTGVSLGQTAAMQMQKTEELTLYVIELNKEIEALKREIQDLKKGGK